MLRFGIKLFTRVQTPKMIIPRFNICASSVQPHPIYLVCAEKSRFSDDSRSDRNFRRYFNEKIILCGTFLTLLGFEDKLSDEDELIMTIKRSILLYNREEYNKAEQLLHIALRTAQQIQHQKGVTYIYDMLGNLAFDQNQLEKAEKLFVSVMQRLIGSGYPQNDIRNVYISAKLAKIYHLKGDLENAGVGYRWTLKEMENQIKQPGGEGLLDVYGIIMMWYGQLLIAMENYAEGLDQMMDAYDILKDNVENGHHLILLLNDVAAVCDTLNDIVKAEKYMKLAFEIAKKIQYRDRCVLHVNMGRIYLRKKYYELARKQCGLGWRFAKESDNEKCEEEAMLCSIEAEKLFQEQKRSKI